MPESAPRRVVVFDRIDSNRRATLLLSGISGLAMIPVVAGLSPYLAFWVVLFLPGLSDFMQDAGKGITTYVVLIVSIPLILVAGALYLQYRHADRIALRMARARPLGRDRERRLWDTVEGLCVGTGLPLPKLYVVETEIPNAFSVGLAPDRSSIVVTRGLLSLLTPRELEGVLAHEGIPRDGPPVHRGPAGGRAVVERDGIDPSPRGRADRTARRDGGRDPPGDRGRKGPGGERTPP